MPSLLKFTLASIAAAPLLAGCGGSSTAGPNPYSGARTNATAAPAASAGITARAVTVKLGSSSALGSSVLVNGRGLTLYRLSAEQGGKFICAANCLKSWHPLIVASGARASGTVAGLGILKRPDGKAQVAYRGMPLYTFTHDQFPGQLNGEGIKDVGTWNAVKAAAPAGPKPSASSAPAPYGGRSAY